MGKIDDIFDKIDSGLDKMSVLGKLRGSDSDDDEEGKEVWKWRCVSGNMTFQNPTTGKEIVKPLYNWHAFVGDVSMCGQVSDRIVDQPLGSGLCLTCQECMKLTERGQD